MNETAIDWTNFTWNPASGCKKISQGCKYCYADILAENKRGTRAFPNGFDLTIRPHKLNEPFKLKEPSLIFVNSMSDLFFEEIPDSYRKRIIDIIWQTPQHEYQVLTKRTEKMKEYFQTRQVPPNFWVGTSIENQEQLHRLETLKKIDAEIRFLSLEPLLSDLPELVLTGIHWVITGGESGTHLNNPEINQKRGLAEKVNGHWIPRRDRIDWIRQIRDLCIKQNVKFFHKQWGGPMSKSSGNLLDGKKWHEYPRMPGQTEMDLPLFAAG
ncbi:MAG: hypothetical protein CMI54_02445 [Parcubacteria group bacterium]|nr:hypothetical protein [Parcubacteria group bacterium]|tara:strand:+ start:14955 stop:15761 length:807 start_codon:yes stop_codon:yes gene_type:complete